ncbi:hypothetical protein BpHYR1_014060 [Brachionus plicatilis]|uniref:Uncharacterized protein n=1 Tax=Brachionus plicatilis TaxID=10195 RepID=A0A3M7T6R0_BRAPC|nr:hypothetical protein BpHYR1_014060 [Brachionus plicatilis]
MQSLNEEEDSTGFEIALIIVYFAFVFDSIYDVCNKIFPNKLINIDTMEPSRMENIRMGWKKNIWTKTKNKIFI